MDKTINCHGYECTIQETEEGYTINIKGDKEKIKARVEMMEAYLNFKEKAAAAGFSGHHPRNPHKAMGEAFFSHVHAHLKVMHDKECQTKDSQEKA